LVKADKEKLSRLLDYWIGHNEEHGDEFREWADKVRGSASDEVCAHIFEAAKQMDRANQFLLKALETLKAERTS
jgi:rubrerythrin